MSFNWAYCAASCSVRAEHRAASVGELRMKDLLYAANTTSSGSRTTHEHTSRAESACERQLQHYRRRTQLSFKLLNVI